ncbi:MAG: UDP-N-acetylmuramate--L-alanine ligase [Thermodesulfovibrionales bacterium]|nr:UDP-N-acetylmuramate--L-alanine ligase [Thermodesulfovibrionales bacterium]
MFEQYRIIHFVGIGGIGMSGIAEVLHNLGYEVTGSDIKDSDTTNRLHSLGIKIYIGHKAENVDDAHVVVISSAVSKDNPEVVAAKEKSIPVIPRAEMLAELARMKYGVLIAGAHGKTTTTSLISTVLAHGGLDPTVVIGGRLMATGSNARLGQGAFLIAEADESDGSFLKLSPTIAVVTNIDREHMDFFKTMDSLREAFLSFMNKVPFYGASIVCIENEEIRRLVPSVHRRCITYGLSSDADIYAVDINKGFMSVSFDVIHKGKNLGNFSIPVPGLHNVLNSLACIAVAMELKMETGKVKEALNKFSGIQRRFELKGDEKGVKVFDDYGHHPTEIKATLRAAKEGLSGRIQNTEDRIQRELSQIYGRSRRIGTVPEPEGTGRLFVIFQPHRYTRTRDLIDEFSGCFADADVLYLMDIYPAGEKPIDGINSNVLIDRIKKAGHEGAVYFSDREKLMENLLLRLRQGDVVFTLGAGDVWKAGEEILKRLRLKAGG